MRGGEHEVSGHPLLAAHPDAGGKPALVPGAPLGYLTAYRADHPDLVRPVEIWPRLLARPAHRAAIEEPRHARTPATGAGEEESATGAGGGTKTAGAGPTGAEIAAYRRAVNNARKLLDAWQLLGSTLLPGSFARAVGRAR